MLKEPIIYIGLQIYVWPLSHYLMLALLATRPFFFFYLQHVLHSMEQAVHWLLREYK